jgi:hypothetical protein
MEENRIKVVGQEELFRTDDYRIVRVGRWFYLKDDPKVVRVRENRDNWGDWRCGYLYAGSKKIIEWNGNLYNKDYCVKLEYTDTYAPEESQEVIHLDGKYHHVDSIVKIENKNVSVYDENIVAAWNGGFAYRKDCIRLSEYFYPKKDRPYRIGETILKGDRFNNVWVRKIDMLPRDENAPSSFHSILSDLSRNMSPMERENPGTGSAIPSIDNFWRRQEKGVIRAVCSIDNYNKEHIIKRQDSNYHFHQTSDTEWRASILHKLDSACHIHYALFPVVYNLCDGNIYVDRFLAETASIGLSSIENNPNLFEFSGIHDVFCYKPMVTTEELEERYDEDMHEYLRDSSVTAKEHVEKNYSENGPDENQAEVVDFNYVRPRGGKSIIDYRHVLEKSPSCKRFGSKRYSFGVEIETTYGKVPEEILKEHRLALVSDGSIRAGEYVTSPLHGDLGFRNLKAMMDAISKYCLVSNEGAAHVHIGGANFNRRFSVFGIMTGCQIEEEMFLMQPPNKHPKNRYCSGISRDWGEDSNGQRHSRDYRHISLDNWKEVLGEYVFGRPFGRGMNSLHDMPRWNKYRHKWLNLVNCNSVGRFDTIEFRIFGVTTSFEKIYNYVLLSMAIVWFIENKQGRIMECHKEFLGSGEGLTLKEIVTSAYKYREDISEKLITFIEARKQKFNRNL